MYDERSVLTDCKNQEADSNNDIMDNSWGTPILNSKSSLNAPYSFLQFGAPSLEFLFLKFGTPNHSFAIS
jgi:hypothetical protein